MIKASELMKELKITRPTLNKWMTKGCPFYRVCGTLFFDLSEVSDWIKNGDTNG